MPSSKGLMPETEKNFLCMLFGLDRVDSDLAASTFMKTSFLLFDKGKIYSLSWGQLIMLSIGEYRVLVASTQQKRTIYYKIVLYDSTKQIELDTVVLNDWYWGVSLPGFLQAELSGGLRKTLSISEILTDFYELCSKKPELAKSFLKTMDRPTESLSRSLFVSGGLPTLGKSR